MKTTKLQTPITAETSNPKHQTSSRWSLRFGGLGNTGAATRFLAAFRGTAFGALWLVLCGSAYGQNFAIDWYTVDGGGGTSSGGVYSITGTAGQPDAGRMSGGQYTLDGGFWGLIAAVQAPGAPFLSIVSASPGQVTLSWTPATPGFGLQQTAVLAPANWTNSPSGATNPITVSVTAPTRFYRLVKP